MKNSTGSKKDKTEKTKTTKTEAAPKPAKAQKKAKQPADRLPATVEELKAGKAGLATYLFLSGKDKDAIASELKRAFKLSDTMAVKITRRIVGRTRFFQRALSLVATK